MPTKSSAVRISRPKKSSFRFFLPFILGTAALSFVLMGLMVSIQTISSLQEVRSQAAAAPSVQLRMHGQTVAAGELRIDFLLNSGVHKVGSSVVTAKLQGIQASEVRLDLGNSINLETVTQTVTGVADGTVIKFSQKAPADVNRPVMTRGQELKMASVFVKRPQGGEFTLTVDRAAANTKIAVIGQPTAVTDVTASQKFTVNTTGPRPIESPRPTPSLIVYASAQPQNVGANRSCNQDCSTKNDCQNGLTCYTNRCRNPRNLGNTSCSNPPTPRPTPRPVAVASPKGTAASVEPTVAPSPSSSPSPSPSSTPRSTATPSATPSGTIYDENTLRVTPTPRPRITPAPTPKATATATSSNNRRFLTAGVILLLGLGIVIPVGIYLYRNVG